MRRKLGDEGKSLVRFGGVFSRRCLLIGLSPCVIGPFSKPPRPKSKENPAQREHRHSDRQRRPKRHFGSEGREQRRPHNRRRDAPKNDTVYGHEVPYSSASESFPLVRLIVHRLNLSSNRSPERPNEDSRHPRPHFPVRGGGREVIGATSLCCRSLRQLRHRQAGDGTSCGFP